MLLCSLLVNCTISRSKRWVLWQARSSRNVCCSRAMYRVQTMGHGQNGAVFRVTIDEESDLCGSDTSFALKCVYNYGNTNTRSLQQYKHEFRLLARLPPHPNMVRFFRQFHARPSRSMLEHLPSAAREAAQFRGGKTLRTKPLMSQWAVFEWLPLTLKQWRGALCEEIGEDLILPWRDVAKKVLDVGRALCHLEKHQVVQARTTH